MKNNTIFSIKVVSADNCLIKPVPNLDTTYSEFKQSKIRSVPLIRIFGSTPSGENNYYRAIYNADFLFSPNNFILLVH